MKYRSEKWLADLRFHDSVWMLEFMDGDTLIFSAEGVCIRKGAAQNGAECDMELEMAQLTLSGFTLLSFSGPDGEGLESAAALMCRGFKVLSLTEEARGQYHLSLSAPGLPFCEMRFSCAAAKVEWDGFARPAWYTNHKA